MAGPTRALKTYEVNMADKFYSHRNLEFMLYEVLDLEQLTRQPFFEDHGRETFDLVLDTARRIGRDLLFPAFQDLDKNPPVYEDGRVKVHPLIRAFLSQCGEGGWITSMFPYEFDGQQLPLTLAISCTFIFSAANFSAGAYPGLTTGASHLIISFGDENLQKTYLPPMASGRWQGTMALTEPQAGSSLSDVAAMAEPGPDGSYYLIKGQKIFISAGEHDGVDNVVHLMLAKIKGGPPGVKGISLFVAPKLRPEGGELVPNDVLCTGIYHKMGYRGCPITHLSLGENDDCRGWLVGEPHKGLSYMFQMMNEARLGVGLQATSIASAAYYASLDYARERPQGRNIASKDPTQPQIPIIEHADVKRMLLFQRAVVEGSLALNLTCAMYEDRLKDENENRDRLHLLLDLLTPIAKTYPSENGILSVSQALQILGGYGYCDEFPVEQYYRDMRIHPIHEGTTGIQAMDLLGRKAVMHGGQALQFFNEEVEAVIKAVEEQADLAEYGRRLQRALRSLQDVTAHLIGLALEGKIELFLADATLYLEMFGITALAWQWLIQGLTAARGLAAGPSEADRKFYQGKLTTMRYFFHYELPKTTGLAERLKESDGLTLSAGNDDFSH